MTAYISVYGGYIWLQEPTTGAWYQYYIPTGGYAVDGNGNSIAADNETAAENFYLALDQMQIGTNRAAPAFPAVPLGTSNLPYPPGSPLYSFPNSDDSAVGNEIDARWGVYTRMLQNGDLFSVKFADGTIAYYQLTSTLLPGGQEIRFWTWIKAFDKNGVQIGKDGKPMPNPNSNPQTPPGGGGGIWQSTTNYAALGPSLDGNQYAWQLASAGACATQQTISINGQVDSTGTFWVPCP